jgi:hypothetical protein
VTLANSPEEERAIAAGQRRRGDGDAHRRRQRALLGAPR